jgi:hypothetical protein
LRFIIFGRASHGVQTKTMNISFIYMFPVWFIILEHEQCSQTCYCKYLIYSCCPSRLLTTCTARTLHCFIRQNWLAYLRQENNVCTVWYIEILRSLNRCSDHHMALILAIRFGLLYVTYSVLVLRQLGRWFRATVWGPYSLMVPHWFLLNRQCHSWTHCKYFIHLFLS